MDKERLELNIRIERLQLFLLRYFSITIAINCLFWFTVFINLEQLIVPIINVVGIILALLFYFVINRYKFNYLYAIEIGVFFITLTIYASVIAVWEKLPMVFLWFILVPLGLAIVKPFRIILHWSIGIVLLVLSTPFVTKILKNNFSIQLNNDFSPDTLLIINFSIFFFVLCIVLMILYFYTQLNKLKNDQLRFIHSKPENTFIINDLSGGLVEQADIENNIIEESKQKELFIKIEEHFSKTNCYRDPSYSIRKLADELDSNVKYISIALNNKEGRSFKAVLNNYRINEIKQKLDNKEYEKYTLKHIYNSAGFEHQSTFNRVFKDFLDLTPSQYIENIKSKK